jgi:hypothetical protein
VTEKNDQQQNYTEEQAERSKEQLRHYLYDHHPASIHDLERKIEDLEERLRHLERRVSWNYL